MRRPTPLASPHLIAAMVTPFTTEGAVDTASLVRLTAYLQQAGITEFFVAGSTGESPLLDESDRLRIIENVRGAAPSAVIYAGISGTGHGHAIRNARSAAQAGADVVVLMSPYFIALNQEQLVTYCCTVADRSPAPVAVYHHVRMPTPFAVPTIVRLAGHPNLIAIKDTNGGDHNRCAEIIAALEGKNFLFLQGVEKLALGTLRAGGHGCVVAQACIAPWLFRGLVDAWRTGDQPTADRFQVRIDALWAIFSRPEVKQSFLHFLRTLKLPLHDRGILASPGCALAHVTFDPAFDDFVREFMRANLDVKSANPE